MTCICSLLGDEGSRSSNPISHYADSSRSPRPGGESSSRASNRRGRSCGNHRSAFGAALGGGAEVVAAGQAQRLPAPPAQPMSRSQPEHGWDGQCEQNCGIWGTQNPAARVSKRMTRLEPKTEKGLINPGPVEHGEFFLGARRAPIPAQVMIYDVEAASPWIIHVVVSAELRQEATVTGGCGKRPRFSTDGH